MRALVVRFPGEDISRLRVLANTHAQPISALLHHALGLPRIADSLEDDTRSAVGC
jgi:hypothetical protein